MQKAGLGVDMRRLLVDWWNLSVDQWVVVSRHQKFGLLDFYCLFDQSPLPSRLMILSVDQWILSSRHEKWCPLKFFCLVDQCLLLNRLMILSVDQSVVPGRHEKWSSLELFYPVDQSTVVSIRASGFSVSVDWWVVVSRSMYCCSIFSCAILHIGRLEFVPVDI